MRHWSLTTVRETVLRATREPIAELQAYGIDTLAISSGTARALLKVGRRLGLISAHQRHLGRSTFSQLAATLAGLDSDALAELGVVASRHDSIAIGAAIFDVLLGQLGCPVVYVARAALREGVLVDLARRDAVLPARLAVGG
jgi:exopolyphosphatase/pppGpp-phosphohydrolase